MVRIQTRDPDYEALAEQFITQHYPCFFKSHWWVWSPKICSWHFEELPNILTAFEEHFEVYDLDVDSPGKKTRIRNVLERIGLKHEPNTPHKHWVQFGTQIYDVSKNECLGTAMPQYFHTNPIPWTPDKNAKTPTIDKLFGEWIEEKGDDKETKRLKILLLKQILAFHTLRYIPTSRMHILLGGGRNGKSVFADVLQKFIGDENCTSASLDRIADSNFEIANLYKKLSCIISETNFNTISMTDKLKKLTSGDVVGFEFKNVTKIKGRNYASILVMSNTLPKTKDKSDAFFRRMIIVNFPNNFDEERDIMSEIPDSEYNGLAAQVLEILPELLKNRKFALEKSIDEKRQLYEEHSNPLEKFFEENVEYGDVNDIIWKWEFEERFNIFAKEKGYSEHTKHAIGRFLSSQKNLRDGYRTPESNRNKQWHCWIGIRWRNEYIKGEKGFLKNCSEFKKANSINEGAEAYLEDYKHDTL